MGENPPVNVIYNRFLGGWPPTEFTLYIMLFTSFYPQNMPSCNFQKYGEYRFVLQSITVGAKTVDKFVLELLMLFFLSIKIYLKKDNTFYDK
jgi:hypothetical protein